MNLLSNPQLLIAPYPKRRTIFVFLNSLWEICWKTSLRKKMKNFSLFFNPEDNFCNLLTQKELKDYISYVEKGIKEIYPTYQIFYILNGNPLYSKSFKFLSNVIYYPSNIEESNLKSKSYKQNILLEELYNHQFLDAGLPFPFEKNK